LRIAPAPLLATLLLAAQSGLAALPPGWTDHDISSPGRAGAATYSGGTWTIYGGGSDICNSDQLHFASTLFSGDGTLIAQVLTVQNAPFGQAGIMLRSDLNSGALEAAVLATTNSGITFEWRSTPGNGCASQIAITAQGLGAPIWLKLV